MFYGLLFIILCWFSRFFNICIVFAKLNFGPIINFACNDIVAFCFCRHLNLPISFPSGGVSADARRRSSADLSQGRTLKAPFHLLLLILG